ncbi:FecR family protein [Telluribacter sp. SYSU D00476]|uniref:FecR family protein n=1 Tax=Telluribacter sp. SYSU D00476 TaxID=2811430 RepID=UPI001FF6C21A|nr:FecR family protein [Telluribacter sp. SYSU D00476]
MPTIHQLLDKLVQGTITEEEERYLFSWLNNHQDEWAFSQYTAYIQLLKNKHKALEEEKATLILQKIHNRIVVDAPLASEPDAAGPATTEDYRTPMLRSRFQFRYWAAAASVLLLILSGWWYWSSMAELTSGEGSVASNAPHVIENSNQSSGIKPVALPDGSSVLLYPDSKISFTDSLQGNQRVVHLWGKAFFEVSKDSLRPFMVVTTDMVTKVLGTSFMVEAFENQKNFSVTVKTGKVSVTTNDKVTFGEARPTRSIQLTANQQAVLARSNQSFTAVSIQPELVPELIPPAPLTYRFRDVPVVQILKTLSQDYGIPIQVDEKVLSGCSLTTTLADKSLFEKLKIICEGIGPGTYYTVREESISITSLGCNN